MKYLDEYRDPALFDRLVSTIKRRAEFLQRTITLMEVCGSHTNAIGRFGIREVLPKNIRLISGPGCPVCVTATDDIDAAIFLARQKNTILTTFGDMVRVPGTDGASLESVRATGGDVRIVFSPLDSLSLAQSNKNREVVFLGVGFETTSPTIAATVKSAQKKSVGNFSVFSIHKTIPSAIIALITNPLLAIDGFLCPGHVSTIIGRDAYHVIPEHGRAAVIAGFEPIDILEAILMLIDQIIDSNVSVEIQYARGVKAEGNIPARRIIEEVFTPTDAKWRGLGLIPQSGLSFSETFAPFDARCRFSFPSFDSRDPKGCSCGEILIGVKSPHDCPLFGKACTPRSPIGPCMVSSEGACASFFKYHR